MPKVERVFDDEIATRLGGEAKAINEKFGVLGTFIVTISRVPDGIIASSGHSTGGLDLGDVPIEHIRYALRVMLFKSTIELAQLHFKELTVPEGFREAVAQDAVVRMRKPDA